MIEQLAQRDNDWRQMALKITKDKDLADDIVQEMYLKSHTFKNINNSYIYTVLRNLFYDSLKTKEILIDDFTRFEIVDDYEVNEIDLFRTKEELDEVMNSLSWLEKTIIDRCYVYGQRGLSRMADIPLQTVHLINKKAKEKLICQLKNQNLEQ